MSRQILKQWLEFSNSETKPLFWMLIGPLLVILTLVLTIPTLSNPFLPLITVMGLVVSWRYRANGFALTLLVFILYFSLSYFLGHREAFFWKIGWGCSLVLGLTISFLTMEELKSYYTGQKEKKDQLVSELKLSLHNSTEKEASNKRNAEREVASYQEKQKILQDEIKVLSVLVEGSQIECEKIFKHSDTLSKKSLDMHRQIDTLKKELCSARESLDSLQSEYNLLQQTADERLDVLNTKRIESYQAHLLIKGYEKQITRAREYFSTQKKLSGQKKDEQIKSSSTGYSQNIKKIDKSQQLALKNLEKDKGITKKYYDQMKFDFVALQKIIQEKKLSIKAPPCEMSEAQIEKLNFQLNEKKKNLDQAKSKLIGIEREIFVIKKSFQEKGTFVE